MKKIIKSLFAIICLIVTLTFSTVLCYADSFVLTAHRPLRSELISETLIFEEASKKAFSKDFSKILDIKNLIQKKVFSVTLVHTNKKYDECIFLNIKIICGIDGISDDIGEIVPFYKVISESAASYDKICSAVARLNTTRFPESPQNLSVFYHQNNNQYRYAVIDILNEFDL